MDLTWNSDFCILNLAWRSLNLWGWLGEPNPENANDVSLERINFRSPLIFVWVEYAADNWVVGRDGASHRKVKYGRREEMEQKGVTPRTPPNLWDVNTKKSEGAKHPQKVNKNQTTPKKWSHLIIGIYTKKKVAAFVDVFLKYCH